MKREGRLMEKIVDSDNIRLAWLKTIRGKRTQLSVLHFRELLEENLFKIAHDLTEGDYQWGTFNQFTIYDPKERQISVAPLRDRITYHAIINICEPIFEKFQIDQSYACRKGKGQSAAIRQSVEYASQNKWYLKLDIRKYFDSVLHDRLKYFLFQTFKDQQLLHILYNLIDSYQGPFPQSGIPIGSLTSQFFANHYLGRLDHFVKEKLHCRSYLRYMDDFVLWNDNKEGLKKWHKDLENFIRDQLLLTMKPCCLNRSDMGLPFLGYRIYPGQVRLSHRSRYRFRRKYRTAFLLYENDVWNEEDLQRHLEPLCAFVKNADSMAFRQRIIENRGHRG